MRCGRGNPQGNPLPDYPIKADGTLSDGTGKRIWGTAVGDWGRVNGESNFDVDTAGVVFGANHTFDRTVRAGFTFGALHTSSDGEGSEYTGDSSRIGISLTGGCLFHTS